jgi:hypothetical protein
MLVRSKTSRGATFVLIKRQHLMASTIDTIARAPTMGVATPMTSRYQGSCDHPAA